MPQTGNGASGGSVYIIRDSPYEDKKRIATELAGPCGVIHIVDNGQVKPEFRQSLGSGRLIICYSENGNKGIGPYVTAAKKAGRSVAYVRSSQ